MRLRPLAFFLLLPILLIAAGCGGGSDDEDVKGMLKTAFSKPIKSADLSMDAKVKLEGIEQLKEPVAFKLSGPYKTNGDNKLPGLDFKGNVSAAGQNITFGFVSTGDNAFVNIQGTDYEVGEKVVADLNKQLAAQRGKSKDQNLAALGINPLDWMSDAKEEGDEKVAGADTTHISAKLDVAKMLDDLNSAIDKAPRDAGTPTPKKLTDQQKKDITEIVKDPTVDVYVAKDDDTLRRLSADIEFEVPEEDRAKAQGLSGGSIAFSVELANVGGDQQIKAPANARPLEELGSQLGGLGGGLAPQPDSGSGSGGSGSGGSDDSGSGGSSGGSGGADVEQFERYSDCLKKAGSDDAKAIEKCAAILNGG